MTWNGLVVSIDGEQQPAWFSTFAYSIECRSAIDDLDMSEARCEETLTVVFDLDCARDAADVGCHALCHGFGEFMLQSNVAYRQHATRLEDAGNLAEMQACRVQD